MSSLIEYKLSDLMKIKYGKDHKHLADGKYPLYGSGGIMRFVEKPLYDGESILIPRKGTLGNLFYLNEPFWSVDTMFYSQIKQELVLPKYLFYTLKTCDLASLNVGSAVPSLTTEVLNEVLITIPPLPTQKAIAEILSSLDDKIELNNQINKNLEALAQALFKQWFIDFEFPNENGEPYKSSGGEMIDSELGEIPKGWEFRKLSDIIQIIGGGTPKRSIEAYWNGDIPWFSIQDISTHPIIIETKEKITSEGLKNSSTRVLPKGTTIITARGTVGKLAFLGEEMAMNQSCYGINGKQGIGPFFNFFNLKEAVEILKRNSHGAVFDTITTGTFDTVNVAIGPIQTIKLFDKTIEAFFEKIESLVRENRVLVGLRDTLLPKLISGEFEVQQIEKEVYG